MSRRIKFVWVSTGNLSDEQYEKLLADPDVDFVGGRFRRTVYEDYSEGSGTGPDAYPAFGTSDCPARVRGSR